MPAPSYFFHIAIDLYRPSRSWQTGDLAKHNHFGKSGKEPFTFRLLQNGASIEHERLSTTSLLAKDEDDQRHLNNDWRVGQIAIQNISTSNLSKPQLTNGLMSRQTTLSQDDTASPQRPPEVTNISSSGIRFGGSLQSSSNPFATKARYEPLSTTEDDLGWGIIRLYRDKDETPGLYDEYTNQGASRHGRSSARQGGGDAGPSFKDEDCNTLCILAVPSYIKPADFLGFVGERTREDVSQFHMLRTDRINRYMVLLKFRSGKRAREWRKEWNGKPFDDMGAENCHVVFIKSIKFRTQHDSDHPDYFTYVPNDRPLVPTSSETTLLQPPASLKSKPIAPPTPALKELPTCPVCLERMDESSGLLTILCQHVFHCTCLERWRGSGCPVCRYTQDDLSAHRAARSDPPQQLNECGICHSDLNLWVCLICGHVGCGRYDAAHAFLHYKQTSHCFSMDLTTQRVWDYDSDGYVHRIMQNKTDGKFLELPAAAANYDHNTRPAAEEESVPRQKLETLGLEYTHLLTSQLESQRLYFEEKLERAADKASEASAAAIAAADGAERAVATLSALQVNYDTLTTETLPELQKDRDRVMRKSEKFETMARRMEQSWRDEKAVAESLLEKVKFLDEKVTTLQNENLELKETNRDMSFFISGQEKLKEMELGEDVTEGTISMPAEKKGRGKGRRK